MGDVHIYNGPQPEQKPKQSFEPEMVLVPAGEFLMGHAPGDGIPDHETPEHTLTLPEFSIGHFPVTNQQYAAFLRAHQGRFAPKGWIMGEPPRDKPDHPVTSVSWRDAVAYCEWLSNQTGRRYRMPSEAEWEKAARGSDGRIYPWGDQWRDGLCNADTGTGTAVGAFRAGKSEAGCEDLLGNVQEWTATRWGSDPRNPDYIYPYRRDDGRENLQTTGRGGFRVHRGGSWRDDPTQLRNTARGVSSVNSRVQWRGFRILQESD